MYPNPELDRVFPLSGGSSERMRLRAPRVLAGLKPMPTTVMGNRAFMRAWAARRMARAAAARALDAQEVVGSATNTVGAIPGFLG